MKLCSNTACITNSYPIMGDNEHVHSESYAATFSWRTNQTFHLVETNLSLFYFRKSKNEKTF